MAAYEVCISDERIVIIDSFISVEIEMKSPTMNYVLHVLSLYFTLVQHFEPESMVSNGESSLCQK